jgi:hypothetical protein
MVVFWNAAKFTMGHALILLLLGKESFNIDIVRFVHVLNKGYKYYIPIHLIPLLIFKRRKIIREYKI